MANGTVYWVGADNNVWAKGPNGNVTNWGAAKATSANGAEAALGSIQGTQISDPNPPVSSNITTGGTTTDPATNQAIANTQSAINRTGTQLTAGNASLDNQYQSAIQQLLLGKNQGQASYNQGTQTNATNFVGAKNTIGSNAGSSLNGLLRLLGSRGAGGGSAYNVSAPDAVARGATLQRADAGTNFATNQQGLDTNWNNYLTGYNNQVTGVGAQRDQGKQTLASNINTNKATLLQTLAGLQASPNAAQPYLDQANSLLDQTANVSAPAINYTTQAYTPPSLASYNPTTTSTSFNGGGSSDYFSPYLQALLGKKQPSIA